MALRDFPSNLAHNNSLFFAISKLLMDPENVFDCIVVGSGHAGSCAALSAVQHGCKRVVVLEKAPQEWGAPNGFFTAGAMRTVHAGLDDVLPIV